MPVSHVKAPQSSKSDVDKAITSLHSEKISLKKLIMIIIIIMNKSQESMFFGGRLKLTSAMKQRPEK